ncbi:PD-(D/E)XK nuclease superfamily protein [Breznakia blatticola]|uniref:PD-(D/E)XK nuclease superfamily protein n=1 Tax=Breznakia blatticola TaxID=1754012 RepID=A0A4R7ZQ36_9FIRM|nr:PD-(D/E)XK nuclease family protein [Breznakia blatticola]TDW19792.1 PD-(D/E)XK nuclease superfamily protein [Breznakia blatticola]
MRLQQIKEHTMILAPSYLHKQLRSDLLKQTNGLANVSIMSVDTYLASLLRNNYDAYPYQCYLAMQDLALTYFAGVKDNTDFINEVVQFVDDVNFYGIDANQLKESDVYLKELKDIVFNLLTIPSASKEQRERLYALDDASNIVIIDDFANERHRYIYDVLQQKGATHIAPNLVQPNKEFYYVLNKKEECEAVARYIIGHDIDVSKAKMTLLDTSYQPFIEQIFDRYHIPYSFQSLRKKNRMIFSFTSLLAYYLQPDSEHLAALFETEVFVHPKAQAFVNYVQSFQCTLEDSFTRMEDHVDAAHNTIDANTREAFKKLELDAREVKTEVYEKLKYLLSCFLQEAIVYIEQLVVDNSSFTSIEDVQTIRQIRKEIKISYTYINEKTISLFIERLEALQLKQSKEMLGLQIGELTQPTKEMDYHFVLGATANHFPGFVAKSGLFSENYIKHTDYPSLESRYEFHVQQAIDSLQTSQNLIVFYATSGLDGKVQQPSLEIETLMQQQAKPYPLPFAYQMYQVDTNLQPTYAKALFQKDGMYMGSVSAFEMYANCPYKYFLRHGLKIYEEAKNPLDNSTTGTLMHYIYESLTSQMGKNYASASCAEVAHLIARESKALADVYVQNAKQLQMSQERLLQSLMQNLAYLEMFEETSHLVPTAFEYEFYATIPTTHANVKLHGYIDRLDMNRDFVSVIDYKSSAKKLDLKEVRKGMKLQLPTYLYVAHHEFQRRPVGAYYYSLQNGKQAAYYAKMNRGKLIEQSEEGRKQNFEKTKKLSGWTTSTDFQVMDQDERFIDGIARKKDGSFSASTKIYNIEAVETLLKANLERIVDNLMQANIRIEPVSCAYCKYQDICHNRKDGYERDMLDVDQDIYLVGKLKEESQ